jgi:Domain of unknown function (DU1801)
MAKSPAMSPSDQDVEDFIEAVPDEQKRGDARALCELMSDLTGEPATMWGSSIIGFGRYHYRYASGREGDAPLAGFSPRKQHLVVYLVGDFEDRYPRDLAKLGRYKSSKSCLYLKRLSDVDTNVLRRLIDRSIRVARGVDQEAST